MFACLCFLFRECWHPGRVSCARAVRQAAQPCCWCIQRLLHVVFSRYIHEPKGWLLKHCPPLQNRVDWPQTLVKAMTRASNAADSDSAFQEISEMLDTLGDPYTRIIGPRYASSIAVFGEYCGQSSPAILPLLNTQPCTQSTHAQCRNDERVLPGWLHV